ncbi:MAG: hypothetical protein K2O62_01510, partial [Clostridia bacterium]|nr:hypothetical protein [Clostridia bacterium]
VIGLSACDNTTETLCGSWKTTKFIHQMGDMKIEGERVFDLDIFEDGTLIAHTYDSKANEMYAYTDGQGTWEQVNDNYRLLISFDNGLEMDVKATISKKNLIVVNSSESYNITQTYEMVKYEKTNTGD